MSRFGDLPTSTGAALVEARAAVADAVGELRRPRRSTTRAGRRHQLALRQASEKLWLGALRLADATMLAAGQPLTTEKSGKVQPIPSARRVRQAAGILHRRGMREVALAIQAASDDHRSCWYDGQCDRAATAGNAVVLARAVRSRRLRRTLGV